MTLDREESDIFSGFSLLLSIIVSVVLHLPDVDGTNNPLSVCAFCIVSIAVGY